MVELFVAKTQLDVEKLDLNLRMKQPPCLKKASPLLEAKVASLLHFHFIHNLLHQWPQKVAPERQRADKLRAPWYFLGIAYKNEESTGKTASLKTTLLLIFEMTTSFLRVFHY